MYDGDRFADNQAKTARLTGCSPSEGRMLITPALIAELRYELSAFRFQVDMLQLRLDRFEALYGRKRTKAKGIMCARATGKRKLAF